MRTPEWEEAPSHAATPGPPSQTPDPVTVIEFRGEAAIYTEINEEELGVAV